jgi:tetratricopeptide (TPR) repeat protein
MEELDDKTYESVKTLSEQADALVENDELETAIATYEQALGLIPEPKTNWEASTWLYASIGDTYFFLEDFEKAASNMYNALNCPDGHTNAFIYLRLGESQLELGERKKARENLLRAYMLEGAEIFEEEDPKYKQVIQDLI